MKKTKIVATIGPASWDVDVLKRMFDAGLNVARINASFADTEEIKRITEAVRKVSDELAIMLDLKGHKVRVNNFGEPIELKEGHKFSLFAEKTEEGIYLVSEGDLDLANKLEPDTDILLDDGNIKLNVKEVKGNEIITEVLQGGTLQKGKTVNIPGVHLDFPPVSEKDYKDILTGVELGVDFIAASFVRNVQDLEEIYKLIGAASINVIAKIEDVEGVDNYDEILTKADGIMVARGDLGVEIKAEKVPALQKMFVKKANLMGKPVIVATQMLESMREKATPTRAEIADVANAIYDGADAVMLSAETSTGKYPIEAIKVMYNVAMETEALIAPTMNLPHTPLAKPTTNAIAKAVMYVCKELPIDKILIATKTGNTARNLARFHPTQQVYAFTDSEIFNRRLNLTRGVTGAVLDESTSNRELGVKAIAQTALKHGFVSPSDLVVIVAGANIMGQGATNMLEVQRIENLL